MKCLYILVNELMPRWSHHQYKRCLFLIGSLVVVQALIFYALVSYDFFDDVVATIDKRSASDSSLWQAAELKPSEKNVVIHIPDIHEGPASPRVANVASSAPKPDITVDAAASVGLRPSSSTHQRCNISSPDAISSIKRAKTDHCKQYLADISCSIQNGELYPKALPHFCPSKGLVTGRYVGCFHADNSDKDLFAAQASLKSRSSPQHCIYLCQQAGFPYAALQQGTECLCGHSLPPAKSANADEKKQPSSVDHVCDISCPSKPELFCGGVLAFSIFETGVASFTPIAAVLPDSSSISQQPASIAYLLTVSGRSARQVKRLVKSLYHVDHCIFIHVDSREEYLHNELLSLGSLPGVRLATRRFPTLWGGVSLLNALLDGMRELLFSSSFSDCNWDFVLNLSEADYPIKTNADLVRFLGANRGMNFVKSHGREVKKFLQKQGLEKSFAECEGRMWRIGSRNLPVGLVVDGGSDWVALSRDLVKYVETGNDDLLNGLRIIFNFTLLPAETYFHTVLRNSHFCNTYIDNNLHVTNWKRHLGCQCQHKHVVDWCGCSPNNFVPSDWPRFQTTVPKQLYFARKFDPLVSQNIINQIDDWLHGSPTPESPTLKSYWHNIYSYHDTSIEKDDLLVTCGRSLSRLSTKSLHNSISSSSGSGSKCDFHFDELLEINTYHYDDSYQGSLILFRALINQSYKLLIESYVQPISHTSGQSGTRHLKYQISSGPDYKEQILRNFLGALGPFSEPVLLHQWTSGNPLNLTTIWIDPVGLIASVETVTVNSSAGIHILKPALNRPLRPGIWSVWCQEPRFLNHLRFLVLPLETYQGNPVDANVSKHIHMGPSKPHPVISKEWNKFMPSAKDQTMLRHNELANSRKVDGDLIDWIESLVSRFYSINSLCYSLELNRAGFDGSRLPPCVTHLMEPCEQSPWSTKYPDPKSEIKGVDAATGKLL